VSLLDFIRGSRPPLVQQGLEHLGEMIASAGEMYAAATAHLLDNQPLSLDLAQADERVNELEKEVRRVVFEHVVLNPKDELTLSLLLLSVVQDAERMGDLCKSIAKSVLLAKGPREGRHVVALRLIRDDVAAMFEPARASFVSADTAGARRVMETHAAIKGVVAEFTARLAAADDVSVDMAVTLAVAARMIGRVSAHLSNVASTIAMPFDQIRRSPTWGEDD
jgi:phosphate uptake regulator